MRPVAAKWLMKEPAGQISPTRPLEAKSFGVAGGGFGIGAALAWLAVGLPIAWGAWQTLQSAVKIFQ